jgi:hypothetical protein
MTDGEERPAADGGPYKGKRAGMKASATQTKRAGPFEQTQGKRARPLQMERKRRRRRKAAPTKEREERTHPFKVRKGRPPSARPATASGTQKPRLRRRPLQRQEGGASPAPTKEREERTHPFSEERVGHPRKEFEAYLGITSRASLLITTSRRSWRFLPASSMASREP